MNNQFKENIENIIYYNFKIPHNMAKLNLREIISNLNKIIKSSENSYSPDVEEDQWGLEVAVSQPCPEGDDIDKLIQIYSPLF